MQICKIGPIGGVDASYKCVKYSAGVSRKCNTNALWKYFLKDVYVYIPHKSCKHGCSPYLPTVTTKLMFKSSHTRDRQCVIAIAATVCVHFATNYKANRLQISENARI